jgi:hypothetical protein
VSDTRTRGATVAFVCDLLKTFRSQWLTKGDAARLLELADCDNLSRWIHELEAQGLLTCRPGVKKAATKGKAAAEYRLSPRWGGQA